DLNRGYFDLTFIQRLLSINPLAFDPFSVRTSFPKLQAGKVNVLFSTVYALEREALYNIRLIQNSTWFRLLPRRIKNVRQANQFLVRIAIMILVPALILAGIGGLVVGFLGFLMLLVSLIGFAIAAAILVLNFTWYQPRLIDQVLRPTGFKSTNLTLDEVEEDVARANPDEVRIAKSVEELHRALTDIDQARHVRRQSAPPDEFDPRNRTVTEALVLIHALEGAQCLHGPHLSERFNQIERLREKIATMQRERADQAKQRLKDLTDELYSDPAFEDEVFANLFSLYRRGVAQIGLGHFYPNVVSQTVFSFPERTTELIDEELWAKNWHDLTIGLTPLGFKVVHEMIRLGIIIDLSHTSPAARRDVYDLVDFLEAEYGRRGTVVFSHVGVQAIHRHPYNLADWEIKWLAEHSGLIGVMWSNYWLSGHETVKLGTGYFARTIDHILQVSGGQTNLIAFGSDLDGFSDPPDELYDATRWPIVTQYLAAELDRVSPDPAFPRYSLADLRAFMGGNAIRILQSGWGRVVGDRLEDLGKQLGSLNNRQALEAAQALRDLALLDSLTHLDLRYADLRHVDLSSADLRGTRFDGADLRGSIFREAQIDPQALENAITNEFTILPDGSPAG
ncbi:MAG: hypothetical protein GYB68_16790, partial [Chloroflexi bacterium]|nr:hypothetical protein [Chloroflexota bacterium]